MMIERDSKGFYCMQKGTKRGALERRLLPLVPRFPANYVEELEDSSSHSDEQQLGNLQQGSIDLSGILVETHSLPGNHMYLLSIFPRVGS